MKIVCYLNDGGMGNPIVAAFAKGCKGILAQVKDYEKVIDKYGPNHIGVFWGILRGNNEAMAVYNNYRITFYMLDHAYIQRGHDKKNYRVQKGFRPPMSLYKFPDDRAKKWKAHELIKPVKPEGENILVLPATLAINNFYAKCIDETMCREFMQCVDDLRDSFNITMRDKAAKRPFAQDLAEADWVMSIHSNGAVEGMLAGAIPITARYNAAFACVPLSYYEEPDYLDVVDCMNARQVAVNNLCYRQFHISEFEDGTAWKILNAKLPATEFDQEEGIEISPFPAPPPPTLRPHPVRAAQPPRDNPYLTGWNPPPIQPHGVVSVDQGTLREMERLASEMDMDLGPPEDEDAPL